MFVKVAKVGDIPEGSAKRVVIQGKSIALFHVGGQLYAIDEHCTHVGGPLSEGEIVGDEVICPWHGARFRIATGEVLGPPARSNVQAYPVRIQGEDIEVDIEL